MAIRKSRRPTRTGRLKTAGAGVGGFNALTPPRPRPVAPELAG
jgi:hypothetical protein